MIALAFALGLAGSAPSLPPGTVSPLARACDGGMLHTSADRALLMRPQDWAAARPRKLGELPDARHEYAVLRMIDGCMVPAPIGYHPPPAR